MFLCTEREVRPDWTDLTPARCKYCCVVLPIISSGQAVFICAKCTKEFNINKVVAAGLVGEGVSA